MLTVKTSYSHGGRGKRVGSLVVGLMTLFVVAPVWSMDIESLDEIRAAAYEFLVANVEEGPGRLEISVADLDSRLRLARCEAPLQASLPEGSRPLGRVTVSVSCTGSKPWSLMVQAVVRRFVEVVSSRMPLGRGAMLREEDLVHTAADIAGLTGGYYTSSQEVAGMILKRSIKAGTVIGPGLIQLPILIKRGEKVIIEAVSGGVTVRMEGESLGAGARGEVIKIRNLSSKQVIEAEIISPGVVRVRM